MPKLTDLTKEMTTAPAVDDLVHIVDVSDTSESPQGSSYKIQTQYLFEDLVLLAGRSGGQTIIGGTDANDNLTLSATSHGTKGQVEITDESNFDINASKIVSGVGTDTIHTVLEYNNASTTKPVVKFSSTIGGLANYHGLHLEVQESGKAVGLHTESYGAAAYNILSSRNVNFTVQDFIGYMSTGQLQSGTRHLWARQFDAPGGNLIFQSINDAVLTNRFILDFATGIPTFTALNVAGGIVRTDGSGVFSTSVTLPNGTLATTQAPGDNTTKLATTAFVTAAVAIENNWDRDISGTPFLKPYNAGDTVHLNDAENTSFYATADLQIFRNDTPDISLWAANATPGADANLNLVRSRGTIGTPAAVQDNDLIGNINYVGYDGTAFRNGAEIRAEIDGTVSTGVLPCKLGFYVNAGAGVATLGMELQKDKNLELQGILKVDQIAELTPAAGTIIGNLNISGVQLGGADVHLVAASGDIQLSAASGTTQVTTGTFSLASGTTVNEISTTIGPLSTNNQLAGALEIYTEFAYLNGKTGGQTASGGSGLSENFDLQSTFAATKGAVRVRDGSSFEFVGSGTGIFKVDENTDAKIYLGRSMISSPTTDVAYWSHYDTGDSNTDYAIKQLATGRTAINSKTGVPVDININNVTQVSVNATTTKINDLTVAKDADGYIQIIPSATVINMQFGNDIFACFINTDTRDVNFEIWGTDSGDPVFITDAGKNNVGIGINLPDANFKLDVAGNLKVSGDIGSTSVRVPKIWATDLEVTNYPSVNGTALSNQYLATTDSPTFAQITASSYINQTGIFAEIYVADASASQTIATGVTYTKSTAFTTNGQSSNCTADATNDKITITQTGRYRVSGSFSGTSGTAGITFRGAAFLNGVEQNQVHFKRKFTTTDSGDMGFTGFIDVTSAPWDLDFRLRHDSGTDKDITIEYANLNVQYIGAT